LGIAASEKLVTHSIDPNALYQDPTTSGFLAKGTDARLRQQALWDLLLHYPAVLSPFDNLNISGLQSYGLVSDQLDQTSQSLAYRQMVESPELIRGVQALVFAELLPKHRVLGTDKAVDEFIRLRASRGHAVASGMSSALYGMYPTFDEYVAGTSALFSGRTFGVPGRSSLLSGEEFGARIASAADRDDFEAFKAYEPHAAFMDDFARSAQRWLALTQASRSLDAVLSASIPSNLLNSPVGVRPPTVLEQIELGAKQGSTHAAVQIWLEEVRFVPKLRTIEDVLRLRDDKRIDAFRAAMLDWTQCLAVTSPAEEMRLRKLVGVANKELEKLAGIERMTRFWTFAAVPLDILLSLYPPVALPVPITSLVGMAILKATDQKMRQLDWVMFGRG
jgi:hypothetical protein